MKGYPSSIIRSKSEFGSSLIVSPDSGFVISSRSSLSSSNRVKVAPISLRNVDQSPY